jgi:hypothetical protein
MTRITSKLCKAINALYGEQDEESCDPGELLKTVERLTTWNKRVAEDLDKMLGTPHDEGSAIDRVVVLGAKLRHLQATIDQLPKCYCLKDGCLVKDVPMTPKMRVWRGDNYEAGEQMVASVSALGVRLCGSNKFRCDFSLANSYEAAKQLGAVWVQEKQ